MTVPRPVRWAVRCVLVVAAVHVAALVLVLTHADVMRGAIAARHPGIPAARLEDLTSTQVLSSVVPHVLLPILLLWRGWRLRGGTRGARVWVTALLVVQLAAHATLKTILDVLPGYGGWVIAVQGFSLGFELAALYLLWVPAPARRFFRPAGAAREPYLLGG